MPFSLGKSHIAYKLSGVELHSRPNSSKPTKPTLSPISCNKNYLVSFQLVIVSLAQCLRQRSSWRLKISLCMRILQDLIDEASNPTTVPERPSPMSPHTSSPSGSPTESFSPSNSFVPSVRQSSLVQFFLGTRSKFCENGIAQSGSIICPLFHSICLEGAVLVGASFSDNPLWMAVLDVLLLAVVDSL
jgi:hypothetical protein